MIVSELVTLLGFRVDNASATQYERKIRSIQGLAAGAVAGISASITNTLTNMVAEIGTAIAMVPVSIARAGDEMVSSLAKIESSIGRSATSAAEAEALYESLHQVGMRTGINADENAAAFTRFNIAMQDLGRPAADTVKFIEGIQSAAIIAGTSTVELTNVMTQLGQALGSGKLQGEELNTLRENMPRFLREVVANMDTTMPEFFKMAEKGELSPAKLIPAMMKASESSMQELANFPLTMSRSFSILTLSAGRFMAELDKQLGLSTAISRMFALIARTLESWRGGLSVVGDLVRQLGTLVADLGGVESIVRLVGSALIVAFGPTALRMVWGFVAASRALAMAMLRALLPLAGFAAWVLIVEDFIVWMQGGKSLFGERFGDFNTVFAGVIEGLQAIRDKFNELVDVQAVMDALVAAFNYLKEIVGIVFAWIKAEVLRAPQDFAEMAASITSTFEYLRGIFNSFWSVCQSVFDGIRNAPEAIREAFQPLGEFFSNLLGSITQRFTAFRDAVMGIVNGVRNTVSSVFGSNEAAVRGAGLGVPAEQSSAIQNFLNRTAPPDVTGRLTGAGGAGQQNNTITNEVTVNAPGADPASVAAGTRAGMARATEGMTSQLGNSLARGLGVANPRVEAPAQ